MVRDMTKGSPMKLILGFSIPLLFGMLFQQFYNLVDTMIVGKTLGVEALAIVFKNRKSKGMFLTLDCRMVKHFPSQLTKIY